MKYSTAVGPVGGVDSGGTTRAKYFIADVPPSIKVHLAFPNMCAIYKARACRIQKRKQLVDRDRACRRHTAVPLGPTHAAAQPGLPE